MCEPLRVSENVNSMFGGASARTRPAKLIRSKNKLRITSFNSHHPVLDDELVVQEPAGGARVDHMLLPQHAGGERGLDNDRAAVELGSDDVHGAAVQLHAGIQRALMRVEPGERGQERGMDVQ